MIDFLETLLSEFKNCFSRKATYKWFIVVIMGLLNRTDKLGVTSFIRSLSLNPKCYESLINFFKSDAYTLSSIKKTWCSLVSRNKKLVTVNGANVLLGDGLKASKEGKHMPGVCKLFQESENVSKSPYTFGHMFGGLSAVIGNSEAYFSVPVSMDIHHGLDACADWDEDLSYRRTSHVVRMIENGYEAAMTMGKSILVLDRYFMTVPAFTRLQELNKEKKLLDIVTRAKNNCIAYEEPEASSEKKKGRPRKKGNSLKLKDLFETRKGDFIKGKAMQYGTSEEVSYLCLDLLWGAKFYQKFRFVLVVSHRGNAILVSTDLSLDPIKIIECYAMRFSIESCFRELKHQLGGFYYRFWTSSLPKLNRFKKRTETDNLSKVTDDKARSRVITTVGATERFVLFSCIAIGLTHMISMDETLSKEVDGHRYLRTKARKKISEATVLDYIRGNFFRLLLLSPESEITQIILERQRPDFNEKTADESEKTIE